MPRRSSDNAHTITLEEYRAAASKGDLSVLRRTGTDMSAHTSQPESQVCSTKPCSGDYTCTKHRPTKTQ